MSRGRYDFITAPDRRGTGSTKWNQMYGWNPEVPAGVVPFSVADMELKNAPEICSGLAAYALSDSVFGYSEPTDAYHAAVVGWMRRRHHWDIDKEWIIPFAGVVPAFFTAVEAYSEPGEGVIIMTPVYYPFYMALDLTGRKTVPTQLVVEDGRYVIDFDDLEEKAKDPATKLLLFCSPHNPVGRVWTRAELERVAEICLRNDVVIISDEIHNDLVLPGYEHTVLATLSDEVADITVTCTAPSKTFNLAGLSCSNIIISNERLRTRFRELLMRNGHFMVGCFGLKACEVAYNEAEPWLDELLGLIDRNRRDLTAFMAEHLPEVTVFELEGTYLMWMDFRPLGMDAATLEEFMHKEALMFFDEGHVFGKEGEGFERINIACPNQTLMDALQRMVDAIDRCGVRELAGAHA